MWERVEQELPQALAALTISVWKYRDWGEVGVMRFSFLCPPTLWFRLGTPSFAAVRQSPQLLTEFQYLISAPVVYAEAELKQKPRQKFLIFLGFTEASTAADRKLYYRSI